MANRPDPARRSPAAHRAVLDAAWGLLDAEGWPAVTVDRIAAAAGVGKQTVYRWWRGKADVVFEAFLDRSRAAAPPLPAAAGLPALLAAAAANFVTLYAGTALGAHLRELLGAAQHDPELAAAMRERWFGPRRDDLRAALRAAEADGRVRAGLDPDDVLDLLFGPLHYRLLVGHTPVTPAFARFTASATITAIGT